MMMKKCKNYRILFLAALFANTAFSQGGFVDVTETAGIDHEYAGYEYGGGAACGDFNNDGYLDIFLPGGNNQPHKLYLNQNDGTFIDVAATSGLTDVQIGVGAVCGDVDNDGDLDIYLACFNGLDRLYLNDGNATFTDITASAGISNPGPGLSAAMADYDNDGDLDIYVINRSLVTESIFYRNNGNLTFTDITRQSRTGVKGQSLGVGFFDYDLDGDQDLMVVDEFKDDHLFRNNGNGSFTDVSDAANLFSSDGMGVDFADYDNDGDFDIYIGDFYGDPLQKNNGDGTFTNVAGEAGIDNDGIGWGVNFMDADNDGDRDVYVINGYMNGLGPERPNVFYSNNGDGSFSKKGDGFGTDILLEGRGSIRADFDRNGYLDIFFVSIKDGKSKLLLNKGGNNNWIGLKLIGQESNRSAIGARVEVRTGNDVQVDEVRSGASYTSMHSLELSFGVGQENRIAEITIHWPSGIVQTVRNVGVNQLLTITETNSTAQDFTSSNLPIVVINTDGQEIPDEPKIFAEMGVIDNGPGVRNHVNDPFNNYSGFIGIEIRGSSSQTWPKKQYGLETQDSLGDGIDVSLMGLPEEEDWILNAPYIDKSFLRNVLSYKLARDMGGYASRTKFCELMLNGEYQGLYILMERIKRDKNRVDISKLDEDEIEGDDLTGGYIVKIDKPGDDYFNSPYAPFAGASQIVTYQYHYPKDDNIVDEQKAYIQNVISEFEDMMWSDDYADSATGYANYIDIPSFVDYFIINELNKNVDAYRLSTFIHKDKDSNGGLLKMGPIWDYNLAFGNANYYDGVDANDWIVRQLQEHPAARADGFQLPFWWRKLLQDEAFADHIQERWLELRSDVLSLDAINSYIDAVSDTLFEAQARNFEIWAGPGEFGGGFWPVPDIFYSFSTYQDETDYLKSWIADRIQWMDEQIVELPLSVTPETPQTVIRSFQLKAGFPNPFNGETTFEYQMPRGNNVNINIYNTLGQRVKKLVSGFRGQGVHMVTWNAIDDQGLAVASGLYVIRAEYESETQARKILYIR